MALGNWIQAHKTTFLSAALLLMAAALVSAVRERITRGKNSGLIIFGVAFLTTAALLVYAKITNGFLF